VIDFGCTKQIDPAYYRKHFRFLDNEVLSNRVLLQECLTEIGVFYESDSNELRKSILEICAVSIELLGRPFRNGCFDFGDESFIQGMYKLGEDNLQSRDLRTMKGASGDVDGVYTNRAYFGLYSLLARLRCRVETRLPEWLQTVSA
jgi:hypothetical protein